VAIRGRLLGEGRVDPPPPLGRGTGEEEAAARLAIFFLRKSEGDHPYLQFY
jgi:hypothetical protein